MDSVNALREQFGDGKLPEITRKITACVACRKQKIRCHMKDSTPPCSRCSKRGLSCTVNKSLQTILQSDVIWKDAVEKKIEQLQDKYNKVARHLSISELITREDTPSAQPGNTPVDRESQAGKSIVVQDQDQTSAPAWEIVMGPHPGAIPGSVISALPVGNDARTKPDIISQGIITAAEAQQYLDQYLNRLDHFVYGILGDNRSLGEIRASSSLLLTAICAVGALHLASSSFEKLYQEFVAVASAQSFSRRLNTDDVRALCIGAFWLTGVSWACVANAVRICSELQLHRSVYGAIEGDRAAYLRTRLCYLVFVCDHQFSVPYGRPPMTSGCEAIQADAEFLEGKHACEDDARLVSQLRLWQVVARVYFTLGSNVDRPLTSTSLNSIRRFGIEIDSIRAEWTERFARNHYVGNYPRKGVGLHSHFAKLYLYSHAFRGVTQPNFRSSDIALEIDELANAALLSATSILQTVVSDVEIQGYLNGLPTYFDLMIAFAVVFLLKVSTSYASYVRVDPEKVTRLVSDLVVVLRDVTASMHGRHVLASVARGVELLLQKCYAAAQGHLDSSASSAALLDQQSLDQSFYDVPINWSDLTLENFYMTDFDFFSSQGTLSGS